MAPCASLHRDASLGNESLSSPNLARNPIVRSKPMPPPRKPGCSVCGKIRIFLFLAIPLLILMWQRPEIEWIQGINSTKFAGDIAVAAFLLVFGWKFWNEYGRDYLKKRREAAKAKDRDLGALASKRASEEP